MHRAQYSYLHTGLNRIEGVRQEGADRSSDECRRETGGVGCRAEGVWIVACNLAPDDGHEAHEAHAVNALAEARRRW